MARASWHIDIEYVYLKIACESPMIYVITLYITINRFSTFSENHDFHKNVYFFGKNFRGTATEKIGMGWDVFTSLLLTKSFILTKTTCIDQNYGFLTNHFDI